MRDYKGMKRQRGRNRGGGGQGGGKPGQNANRAFDSQGPDNTRVRGGAQHVYEKYNQLARDATSSGDRVLAENHLQHAEHYFRTLRVLQPNRPVTEIVGRDTFVNGFDLDFEDEALESAMAAADAAASQPAAQAPQGGEGEASAEGQAERSDRQQGQDGQRREFRDRGERQDRQGGFDRDRQDRGDRPRYENRRDRWEDRGDRQDRQERQGAGQQQGSQAQAGERNADRERQDRGDRPRFENRRDRWETREQPAVAEGVDTNAMVAPESASPPPATFEREGADSSRLLRSED